MANGKRKANASAGHKLGQLVGDWFEEFFVLPLLKTVAGRLHLFLDHRFRTRPARGDRILWIDEDGNSVAYDFVMELGGSEDQLGVPVAFFECCWRRGSRHSKDKARDDTGKLLPMRDTYPTARFLGIVVSGDFTQPARDLILTRDVDLLYVPKEKAIAAFSAIGMQIEYVDQDPEEAKRRLVQQFLKRFSRDSKIAVAEELRSLVGKPAIDTYLDRVRAALGATPQQIRFIARHDSAARVFESVDAATAFLQNPDFDFSRPTERYLYQITYSNGAEFERQIDSLTLLRQLHEQTERLASHMANI